MVSYGSNPSTGKVEIGRFSGLVDGQPSLFSKLQASKRPYFQEQGEWHLMNDTEVDL